MELSSIIIYLLKVITIQGIFYLFYWLALRNNVSHSLNRGYLLTTLLGAFLIPLFRIPVAVEAQPFIENDMLVWIAEPIENSEQMVSSAEKSVSTWSLLPWLYCTVVLFLIGRSSLHLVILQKLKNQSEYVKKQWYKLFRTTLSKPFSFFSSVFIPEEIFGTRSFDQILAHECVHVKKLHSLDRLLVDFLVALFWFNPFIYLYRKALIEVHEFQADASVVKHFDDLIGYQEILYSQLQSASYSGLVSHFNFSTIKKRIVMMNKSKNSKQSKLAYFFIAPVLAMVLFAFTSKEGESSVNQIAEKIEEIAAPLALEESAVSSSQDDEWRPSILPLKSTSKFKVSSTYGMRVDPVSKTKKMHNGIDLATPIGTEVVATADGIVEEISTDSKGYGKMLVLKHGSIYKTRYSQLSEYKVNNGEKVKKGQVVALTGNSGRSSGPHLHYEVLENGENKNPSEFIKNYRIKPMIREIPTPPPSGSASENEEIDEELRIAMKMAEEARMRAQEVANESLEEQQSVAELAKVRAQEALQSAEEARVIAESEEITATEKKRIAELTSKIEASRTQIELSAKEIAETKALMATRAAEMEKESAELRIVIAEKRIEELKKKEKDKKKEKGKRKK